MVCLEILPQLFEKIHVAEAVLAECAEGGRIFVPDLLKEKWIVPVPNDEVATIPILFELDRGEKQTIILAKKNFANKVIIDERIGRRMAEYLGLEVVGTLGVLAKAKSSGLIPSFLGAAEAMCLQGIFYHQSLVRQIAERIGES